MSKNYMEEVARMLGVEPSLTLKVIGYTGGRRAFLCATEGKIRARRQERLMQRSARLYRLQVE